MKIIFFGILLTSTAADDCQGIFFNEKYYNIELVKEGLNRVHQIVYSRNDNKLYFTFEQIAKYPTRILGYLDLKTKETGIIDSVRNATGIAIDQNNNRLYIGGSDGLFFLNINTKVTEKLPAADDIRYLFFKYVLYYTSSRNEAYVFDHGDINPIDELKGVVVERLIVDDDNNIFFLNNKQLFRVKLGTRAINSLEKYAVDTLAVDANFKPYISAKNGIFVYNKYKYALDKVSDMKGLRALTFSGVDDPIYVVVDKIVRLHFNPIPCLGD